MSCLLDGCAHTQDGWQSYLACSQSPNHNSLRWSKKLELKGARVESGNHDDDLMMKGKKLETRRQIQENKIKHKNLKTY
jgi:hypothetical protein